MRGHTPGGISAPNRHSKAGLARGRRCGLWSTVRYRAPLARQFNGWVSDPFATGLGEWVDTLDRVPRGRRIGALVDNAVDQSQAINGLADPVAGQLAA